MARLLDANALLRYILCDNMEQAERAKAAVDEGAFTIPEVLCECVYVLQGRYYRFERAEVAETLLSVLDDVECERMGAMRRALELYGGNNLDFVDCILAASVESEGWELLTFDKKLAKLVSGTA